MRKRIRKRRIWRSIIEEEKEDREEQLAKKYISPPYFISLLFYLFSLIANRLSNSSVVLTDPLYGWS